jgi:hypothetical protein
MHPKAQPGKAGRETSYPQNPQRVFHERIGYMPEHSLLKVPLAAEGVYQAAFFILRHGIDSQVTPEEVLFQRYAGVKVDFKAVITMALLFFGAGQGVFFTALGV